MKALNYLILLLISAGFIFATANSDVYLSQNNVEEPATEPVEEPATEPVEEPATEPVEEPATEPVEEPATEPVEEPATEPVEEPATEPVEEEAQAPIEFKEEFIISANIGTTLPFGTNLKNQFGSGLNFRLGVSTPFGFSFMDKDFKVNGDLNLMNCTANDGAEYENYSIASLGANISTDVSILNVKIGGGLSSSSGTAMYDPYDEISFTTLYISAGMSVDLPVSKLIEMIKVEQLENLGVSVYFEGMEVFGAPADAGTSDMLNLGLTLSYPVLF